MKKTYSNPWIPQEALEILEKESGTILDIGGGAAPFGKAQHIIDIEPFDKDRLLNNHWPENSRDVPWQESEYTQLDIVANHRWPFADNQFDLGLCSHCLEDLRAPIPVALEMQRVCRKMLIICPSRLLEQTRGIEHPKWCGFYHHPWAVYAEGERLIFRRKSGTLQLPKAHIVCPVGKTLKTECGSMFYYGEHVIPEEQAFWNEKEDLDEFAAYIEPFCHRQDFFVPDGKKHSLRFFLWKFKQRFLGHL